MQNFFLLNLRKDLFFHFRMNSAPKCEGLMTLPIKNVVKDRQKINIHMFVQHTVLYENYDQKSAKKMRFLHFRLLFCFFFIVIPMWRAVFLGERKKNMTNTIFACFFICKIYSISIPPTDFVLISLLRRRKKMTKIHQFKMNMKTKWKKISWSQSAFLHFTLLVLYIL